MTTLTPQQRLQLLTDPHSFEPFGANVKSRFSYKTNPDGDGVLCGYAKINHRNVVVIVQDVSYMYGTMGESHSKKITEAVNFAAKTKVPVIAVFNSGGARIQEGISALNPTALIAAAMARISGVVPSVAVILGVNSGATAYISGLMDFIVMVEDSSYMFLTGPKVIEKVTGEKTDKQQLGGTGVHGKQTGLASFVTRSEAEAYTVVKKLLHYMPQHYQDTEGNVVCKHELAAAGPVPKLNEFSLEESKGYDMKEVIAAIVDDHSFLEIQESYAENLITGLTTLCGLKIGIIANQPMVMSGVLDIESSKKFFRFLQWCDAYSMPVLFLTDTPGFIPGVGEEHHNIIGIGSRLLHLLANSTIPKINIVTGKWIGGGYAAMCSKAMGADYVYVWQQARVGVLGADAALALVYANSIREKNYDPQYIQQLRDEYADTVLNPFIAAETGLIDGIIFPQETRQLAAKLFQSLQFKSEKPTARKRPIIPMG